LRVVRIAAVTGGALSARMHVLLVQVYSLR
jgi:hypothetical protein